ncbi:MAG: hypothetical protein FWG10_05265 [Eubacteriaceae bacterium]|nr:hypothetical protein [Eubacteriaceae bacterium]
MNTKQLNDEYIEIVKKHLDQSQKDSSRLEKYLKDEADEFGFIPVDFMFAPKLFNENNKQDFQAACAMMDNILGKVSKEYFENPEFRKVYQFTKLEEELILSECNYDVFIPISRIDIFYDEINGNYKYCEFNTDGTSGMAEEMAIADYLMESKAMEVFSSIHKVYRYNLYDIIIDAIEEAYSTYKYKKENPCIAIVDFMESGVRNEFYQFQLNFERRGYEAVIADIRNLDFDGENLWFDGKQIDLVYRRAVTGEIIEKQEQATTFIEAVLSGKICCIGHPRTQLAHVKEVFSVLQSKEAEALFTAEERAYIAEHFPFTTRLRASNYDYNEVLLNRELWVIKPSDLYASKEVSIGIACSNEEWREAVENGIVNDYLLQEYIEPYKTKNCYFNKEGKLVEGFYGNMVGIYMLCGKYAGAFVRQGANAIISASHQGFSVGTMMVDEK